MASDNVLRQNVTQQQNAHLGPAHLYPLTLTHIVHMASDNVLRQNARQKVKNMSYILHDKKYDKISGKMYDKMNNMTVF